VNNSLYYAVTCAALERPGVSGVFLGLHSLDAPESVDQFKFRMGYGARPVRQRVVFHPWLAPAITSGGHVLLKWLLNRHPEHPALPKIEGMVRFYLEGKQPPGEQHWPERLALRKQELLDRS
jgi:hypothetical protein